MSRPGVDLAYLSDLLKPLGHLCFGFFAIRRRLLPHQAVHCPRGILTPVLFVLKHIIKKLPWKKEIFWWIFAIRRRLLPHKAVHCPRGILTQYCLFWKSMGGTRDYFYARYPCVLVCTYMYYSCQVKEFNKSGVPPVMPNKYNSNVFWNHTW